MTDKDQTEHRRGIPAARSNLWVARRAAEKYLAEAEKEGPDKHSLMLYYGAFFFFARSTETSRDYDSITPILARPDSKDVFILGLGSGITGGAVLGHPVENLVIAENCEPVVRAAKYFEKWNAGALTDKRTTIRVEDARTLLKLSPQQYDVIITQPSNPWMAGVGSVFSREYYELGASRLKPGGIMAQWFHLYDMHDGIVGMVLRTFGNAFPHLELWDTGSGDLVMIGSRTPWSSTPIKTISPSPSAIWTRPKARWPCWSSAGSSVNGMW